MIKIKGEIQKGLGEASRTIELQKPYFKNYIQNIDIYHTGTINLLLENPLIISSPDIKTKPINWVGDWVEEFGFLKIQFETIPSSSSMPIDALIYIAYRSPHFSKHSYKEILAPFVDLNGVNFCNIIINKKINTVNGLWYVI
jgi:hypothetical protein